jgi:hypothetical protein
MAATRTWGTDTPISMPSALRPDQTVYVDMGGFAFTEHGIAHNVTEADLEVFTTPTYLPVPSLQTDR